MEEIKNIKYIQIQSIAKIAHFPTCEESIEALMRLLQNVYPAETIADTLAKGLDAMDYSESGRKARKLLLSIPESEERES